MGHQRLATRHYNFFLSKIGKERKKGMGMLHWMPVAEARKGDGAGGRGGLNLTTTFILRPLTRIEVSTFADGSIFLHVWNQCTGRSLQPHLTLNLTLSPGSTATVGESCGWSLTVRWWKHFYWVWWWSLSPLVSCSSWLSCSILAQGKNGMLSVIIIVINLNSICFVRGTLGMPFWIHRGKDLAILTA